jgi:hypothetical protein
MKGMPVEYKAVERSEEVRRLVFCANYNGCLDHAIRMRWPGFSCEGCGSFEKEKMDGLDLSEDYARCMALAFASGAVALGPETHPSS